VSELLDRLRARVRARVEEAADRVVAAALGQQWTPLPTARAEVTRVTTTDTYDADLAPAPEEPPLEVPFPLPGSLVVDIREPHELAGGVPRGALVLPMDLVPHHVDRLPVDRPLVIACAAGARSLGVASWLRQQGYANAVSLAGGVHDAGVPLDRPAGVRPGTRVTVPAGTEVDGVVLHAALSGEVIVQEGEVLRVRVRDAQGFHVEVQRPAGSTFPDSGDGRGRGPLP
jgi:rhodanese-related sulfurtransferase